MIVKKKKKEEERWILELQLHVKDKTQFVSTALLWNLVKWQWKDLTKSIRIKWTEDGMTAF